MRNHSFLVETLSASQRDRAALQQNYDVRIAVSRFLEAKAQLGITRADQLPTLDGGAGITHVPTAMKQMEAALDVVSKRLPTAYQVN